MLVEVGRLPLKETGGRGPGHGEHAEPAASPFEDDPLFVTGGIERGQRERGGTLLLVALLHVVHAEGKLRAVLSDRGRQGRVGLRARGRFGLGKRLRVCVLPVRRPVGCRMRRRTGLALPVGEVCRPFGVLGPLGIDGAGIDDGRVTFHAAEGVVDVGGRNVPRMACNQIRSEPEQAQHDEGGKHHQRHFLSRPGMHSARIIPRPSPASGTSRKGQNFDRKRCSLRLPRTRRTRSLRRASRRPPARAWPPRHGR